MFMIILELAESLKTMNQLDPAWPNRNVMFFDSLFHRKYTE